MFWDYKNIGESYKFIFNSIKENNLINKKLHINNENRWFDKYHP